MAKRPPFFFFFLGLIGLGAFSALAFFLDFLSTVLASGVGAGAGLGVAAGTSTGTTWETVSPYWANWAKACSSLAASKVPCEGAPV